MMDRFTVNDIREIDCSRTWTTKAGAELRVLEKIPFDILKFGFFNYDQDELKKTGDIRGLRFYTVRYQPTEKIGGTEFHRIRWEYIIGLEGEFKWTSEDLDERIKTSIITPGLGILLPPYILHKFVARKSGSGLLVVCNTLFVPEDKKTHDTYDREAFRDLRFCGF